MEYIEKDISQFIIETVNINKKPLKFLELNTATTVQLLKKGYEVIVKEDERSLCSLFYSIVSPPKNGVLSTITKKIKRRYGK